MIQAKNFIQETWCVGGRCCNSLKIWDFLEKTLRFLCFRFDFSSIPVPVYPGEYFTEYFHSQCFYKWYRAVVMLLCTTCTMWSYNMPLNVLLKTLLLVIIFIYQIKSIKSLFWKLELQMLKHTQKQISTRSLKAFIFTCKRNKNGYDPFLYISYNLIKRAIFFFIKFTSFSWKLGQDLLM